MMDELKAMDEYPIVGDIRGKGLAIGIELVTNKESKTPAIPQTKRLARSLMGDGIIVGTAGQSGNIIRITPPLVISEEEIMTVTRSLKKRLKSA